MLELLDHLKQKKGTGLLLISHDLAVVARIADRVAVVRAGRIVETGDTATVLSDPGLAVHPRAAGRDAEPARGGRAAQQPAGLELAAPAVVDRDRVVLAVEELSQSFRQPGGGRIQAVDDVSFELRAGRTIRIVGESGSGKTALGRIILGLQKPDRGEVLLEGEPWSALSEGRRRERRHSIQAVYQDPLGSFDPRLTAGSILREALALGECQECSGANEPGKWPTRSASRRRCWPADR